MAPIPTQMIFNTLVVLLIIVVLSHVWRGHDTVPPPSVDATPVTALPQQSPDWSPSASVSALDPEQGVRELATRLRSEQEARRRLEKQVAELSVQIQHLARINSVAPIPESASAPPPEFATESASPASGDGGNTGWIDEQALLDAGIDVGQARTVKKQFEKMEMDRLYLRDQATREGWIGTARYVEEVEKLNERIEGIRNEVGESNYGAYLFATGQPNQVIAESVLDSSPAQQAGIMAGDVIVSYDGKYIYTWSDVRTATTSGEPGQQVRLVLNRNGETIETYINRGPLGVRLAVRRQKP